MIKCILLYLYMLQEVVKTENEDEAEEGPQRKRPRVEDEAHVGEEGNSTRSASSIQVQDPSPSRKIRIVSTSSSCDGGGINNNRENPRRIDTGIFSKVPPELYHHILKFLSSEVLILSFIHSTYPLVHICACYL